ncbi:MAG: polymer-forming cytoskeletal protein [Candidatus Cloacimonadota bacterium]|nr:polymer-forming cytoskeletal protein [Candidatus Cloacimonadota bacterium]
MKKNKKVEISTLIGKESKITGDLELKNGIRIDGLIDGKIRTNGLLIIGKSGKAIADIEAEECIVSGTVCGNLNISKTLELNKTAVIEGDITAKILKVEIGATFDGTCSMAKKSKEKEHSTDKKYWIAENEKGENVQSTESV